jgi:hypothetical protein
LQANWFWNHACCHYDHHAVSFRPNLVLVVIQ